jgi:hypothetical protein
MPSSSYPPTHDDHTPSRLLHEAFDDDRHSVIAHSTIGDAESGISIPVGVTPVPVTLGHQNARSYIHGGYHHSGTSFV